jgi:hypothetical protein
MAFSCTHAGDADLTCTLRRQAPAAQRSPRIRREEGNNRGGILLTAAFFENSLPFLKEVFFYNLTIKIDNSNDIFLIS